jgi:hypothetical protein
MSSFGGTYENGRHVVTDKGKKNIRQQNCEDFQWQSLLFDFHENRTSRETFTSALPYFSSFLKTA